MNNNFTINTWSWLNYKLIADNNKIKIVKSEFKSNSDDSLILSDWKLEKNKINDNNQNNLFSKTEDGDMLKKLFNNKINSVKDINNINNVNNNDNNINNNNINNKTNNNINLLIDKNTNEVNSDIEIKNNINDNCDILVMNRKNIINEINFDKNEADSIKDKSNANLDKDINKVNLVKDIWNENYRLYLLNKDIKNYSTLWELWKKIIIFHRLIEIKKNGGVSCLKGSVNDLKFEDLEFEYCTYLESVNKTQRVKYSKIIF